MNMVEIERALRELRLSGMAQTLPTRLMQAQAAQEPFLQTFAAMLQDELDRRRTRLMERRYKRSGLDEKVGLADFDWRFNPKLPRAACFELHTLKSGCLRKWRARAMLMRPLESHRRVSSFTRPPASMRHPWPQCRPHCKNASCAPSLLGACWRTVTPKTCWATNTAASRWMRGCASKPTTALRWSGCCAIALLRASTVFHGAPTQRGKQTGVPLCQTAQRAHQ